MALKKLPSNTSRPSFVVKKPKLEQPSSKFGNQNQDSSFLNKQDENPKSSRVRPSKSFPKIAQKKNRLDFEPNESVAHESMDDAFYDENTSKMNKFELFDENDKNR